MPEPSILWQPGWSWSGSAVRPASCDIVQESSKEYVARVRFGIATDSLDADGREIWREPMPVSREQVAGALTGFRGRIEQIPPMVSAIQIGGRRLHELARAGKEVERQPRPGRDLPTSR